MELTPSITLFPYLHGRLNFAVNVRQLIATRRFDCIVVDLPQSLGTPLFAAIDELPVIEAITAHKFEGQCYYLPVDPSDTAIEALRCARQERIYHDCIGPAQLHEPLSMPPMPDESAIEYLGLDAYCALCQAALCSVPTTHEADRDAQYIAWQLHQLRQTRHSILCCLHLGLCSRTIYHFGQERTHNLSFPERSGDGLIVDRAPINSDHLYFALGELPFVTGLMERERQGVTKSVIGPGDTIKRLFCETRDNYSTSADQVSRLSLTRIQVALTFLRNLAVMDGRLLPSLFDIIEAAKGVGGNSFGVQILTSARYYPFLPLDPAVPTIAIGIDRLMLPGEESPRVAINLLRDRTFTWKTVSLHHDPSMLQGRKFRYAWNPAGMCSHVPEDFRIESFNSHLRKKAIRILADELSRVEKFSSSVKDGIDIRETIRHWYSGDMYVRELPFLRSRIDTVVIIFDADHDERYPHRVMWYAEHSAESTLTFYATNPFDDMIGPGVCRCRYGGLSLLFPPRLVPDIFENPQAQHLGQASLQLIYGALLNSRENTVTLVSAQKPSLVVLAMARKMKKRIVWIPQASFSGETLSKMRTFHILNGKDVRSWASRFIADW